MNHPSVSHAPLRREIGLACACACVALALFLLDTYGTAVPALAPHVLTLSAAVFLLAPRLLLPASLDAARYGHHLRDLGRGLWTGLALLALLLPFFLVGNHLWNRHGLGLDLAAHRGALHQPPAHLHGPLSSLHDDALHVGRVANRLSFRQEGPTSTAWTFTTDAAVLPLNRDTALRLGAFAHTEAPRVPAHLPPVELSPTTSLRLDVALYGGTYVHLASPSADLSATRVGSAATPADPSWLVDGELHIPLGMGWLWALVIAHLLLIALPEEYFFRGYLQRRIEDVRGRRALVTWRGWTITHANVVTSFLFAALHFLLGFDAWRLAVFFPSLVFGALRDRHDGLVAATLFHAGCNLMVLLTLPYYVWLSP